MVVATCSCCCAVSVVSSSRRAEPKTAFIGVLSSWLIAARKADRVRAADVGLAARVGELALEAGDRVAHGVAPAAACWRPMADQRSTAASTIAAWIGFTR